MADDPSGWSEGRTAREWSAGVPTFNAAASRFLRRHAIFLVMMGALAALWALWPGARPLAQILALAVLALWAALTALARPDLRALARGGIQAAAWAARRAFERWRTPLASFRRWLALAMSPKADKDYLQLAQHQSFLAATPLSPFRLVAWITMGLSALSVSWGAFAWFVRVPELQSDVQDARAALESAVSARQVAERDRLAWEQQAADAHAALAAHEEAARREAEESRALAQRARDRRARAHLRDRRIANEMADSRANGGALFDVDRRLRELAGPAAVSDLPAAKAGSDRSGRMPAKPSAAPGVSAADPAADDRGDPADDSEPDAPG